MHARVPCSSAILPLPLHVCKGYRLWRHVYESAARIPGNVAKDKEVPHARRWECTMQRYVAAALQVTSCSICLEDFADGQKVRELPKCQHIYHAHCVDAWLCMHNACPLCRVPAV